MLIVPARKWVKFLKMAGYWSTHRFLSCRFWSLARVGSLPEALGHATPLKSLPGAWCGILNKCIGNINFHNRVCINKVHLECNILTKDWPSMFNLSIFSSISILFTSTTRTEIIASSLPVLQPAHWHHTGNLHDKNCHQESSSGGRGGSKAPYVEVDDLGEDPFVQISYYHNYHLPTAMRQSLSPHCWWRNIKLNHTIILNTILNIFLSNFPCNSISCRCFLSPQSPFWSASWSNHSSHATSGSWLVVLKDFTTKNKLN